MPSAAPSRARNRPDSTDRSVRIAPLAAACSHHQRANRRHCNASARRGGSDSRSISNRARRRAIRPPPARPPHRFGARRLCHRRPRPRPRRFAAARALRPHHSARCRPRRIRRSGCYSLTMPPHHQQHSMPKPASSSSCLAGVGLNSIQSVRSPRRPRRIIFCSTSSRALQWLDPRCFHRRVVSTATLRRAVALVVLVRYLLLVRSLLQAAAARPTIPCGSRRRRRKCARRRSAQRSLRRPVVVGWMGMVVAWWT